MQSLPNSNWGSFQVVRPRWTTDCWSYSTSQSCWGVTILDAHTAGHCSCRLTSLLVYAWPPWVPFCSHQTHSAIYQRHHGVRSYSLSQPVTWFDHLLGCRLVRLPRYPTLYLWVLCVSWRLSYIMVVQAPTHCLTVQCCNAVAEACWIHQLLGELHRPLPRATLIYCDNISVVYLSTNPVHHQRTKHIEIDINFVRECVALGAMRVLHVPTSLQYADIFTKGLPTAVFLNFRSSLNVRSSPSWDCRRVLEYE